MKRSHKAATRAADQASTHDLPGSRRIAATRSALLSWYDENKRDLPWRRSRDPYAIWVSEIMLQQTRVETVIPYYERFLERFPDVESLASADSEDVYGAWTGLGYYSRARNLQATAKILVDEFGGELPREVEQLQRLKGVGRYTAGALSSIAFDRPAPLVDGNVVRVLSRIFGIRDDVAEAAVLERFWELSTALVKGARPGDLNQALMELGAMVCTPRSPLCPTCPMQRRCDAVRRGDAEALPNKTRKMKQQRIEAVAAWLPRGKKVLAVRRPEGGLLGGMWELPGGDMDPTRDGDPESALHRHLAEHLGLELGRADYVGEVAHVFTHRRLRLHVFRCGSPSGRIRRGREGARYDELRWLSPAGVAALPQGGPTRKALALLGEASETPHRQRQRGRRPEPKREASTSEGRRSRGRSREAPTSR